MTVLLTNNPLPREAAGWRAGRPEEDPEKMKRWGFVTAKPSEYLIHVRRGEVTARSGQGATCFKWPWDAVAIVPTSLQRLSFSADQVTAEKVGVEVVGLAVYRIADPLLAYRVLNFSYPERAQEKLESTLTAMFVGATRRIVATLGVEDCLRKRKAALAQELLREIAPVVGGEGHPDDFTSRGWGVVIDTIEIQEVRVLSEAVFAAMQAPYRAELDRQAREATALAEQAIAAREAACRRDAELARLHAEGELAVQRSAAEQKAAERKAAIARLCLDEERATEQRRAEHSASLAAFERGVADEQREAEAQARRRAAELAALEAIAEQQSLPARHALAEQRAELDRLLTMVDAELRRRQAELAREEGLVRAEVALRDADVHCQRSEADAQLELARRLPELARAIGERMGQVNVTQLGGVDMSPLAHVAATISSLLDIARSAHGARSTHGARATRARGRHEGDEHAEP